MSYTNTKTQGDLDPGTLDRGTKPVSVGGVARQTNPTAVDDGDRVSASFDDMGRILTRPYQVRDLISTALASLTTGTKTELISAVSGTYLDLVQIGFYNNSDAATIVTLLDESTTVRTFPVAATSATVLNFQVPLKQNGKNAAWYVDLPDITGTTVTVNAEFIKEV